MNPYAILAAVLLVTGLAAGAYYKGYSNALSESAEEVAQYRENETLLLARIQQAKEEREIVYRDRIKVIEKVPDPSGCLDTRFPDAFIDSLRGESGEAQRGADTGLPLP